MRSRPSASRDTPSRSCTAWQRSARSSMPRRRRSRLRWCMRGCSCPSCRRRNTCTVRRGRRPSAGKVQRRRSGRSRSRCCTDPAAPRRPRTRGPSVRGRIRSRRCSRNWSCSSRRHRGHRRRRRRSRATSRTHSLWRSQPGRSVLREVRGLSCWLRDASAARMSNAGATGRTRDPVGLRDGTRVPRDVGIGGSAPARIVPAYGAQAPARVGRVVFGKREFMAFSKSCFS